MVEKVHIVIGRKPMTAEFDLLTSLKNRALRGSKDEIRCFVSF